GLRTWRAAGTARRIPRSRCPEDPACPTRSLAQVQMPRRERTDLAPPPDRWMPKRPPQPKQRRRSSSQRRSTGASCFPTLEVWLANRVASNGSDGSDFLGVREVVLAQSYRAAFPSDVRWFG